MTVPSLATRITSVLPLWAVEGGRITVLGQGFRSSNGGLPRVTIGDRPARVVYASSDAIAAVVPSGVQGGRAAVRIEGLSGEAAFIEVGTPIATGLHQVDNPAFDRRGNLYVTYSGPRGQQIPVSIFRVRRDGAREPFVSGITNATSLAVDPQGRLHVSSRFDGVVYRIAGDGAHEPVATDLGIACGLAFAPDGTLYVGDRSGTIFRVTAGGETAAFATLPASVAAFHLAFGPDECLYVTAPTLAPRDALYHIDAKGQIAVLASDFGRPQGLGFAAGGDLYVVEALAGSSGVYRVHPDGSRHLVLAGPALIGVAFDPLGGMMVASNDTVYRVETDLRAPG